MTLLISPSFIDGNDCGAIRNGHILGSLAVFGKHPQGIGDFYLE